LLGDRTLADAERQIPSCFRLDRNWELRELAKDDRRELIERCDHHWIHQIWTEEPHLALQGKTPREAAEDPALAEGLAAAVFQLETQVIAMGKATDFTEIRRELKIPVPESVDPWSTPLAQLALPQWSNLDLMKLGQDDAARLFAVAANFRYVGVARTLANLVLDTANDDSVQLSLSISYQMGESEYDPNESIKWYRRAGDLAEKSNQDSFMYRLLAVRMTIETAQSDLLEERLNEAVKAAGENQEHLSVLFQLLQQYGLVQQPAAPNQPAAAQPGPAKPSDGIWTPNSPAQPKSTEDGKESKLWVPGMD